MAGSAATDAVLRRVLAACPGLVELDVSACTGVVFGDKLLAAMGRLERLAVSSAALDDTRLCQLCRVAPLLRQLVIVSCPGISTDAAAAVAEQCAHMEDMTVLFCGRIDDNAARVLATVLPPDATLHHAALDAM